jgi:hypothetical protein
MNVKNIWAIVNKRYRLSAVVQMSFELGYPKYSKGKCWCTINNSYDIKTKRVSLAPKGILFSDSMPLSLFTSSIFIPWAKVLKITISDAIPPIDGILDTHPPSQSNSQTSKFEYCTLQLNDPQKMTISIPWSKEFADFIQTYKLFEIYRD